MRMTVALAATCIALCVVAPAQQDGLLFHASFDEGYHPDFAAGPTTTDAQCAITEGGGGRVGEALIAWRGFRGIELFLSPWYLTAGNIDREQGGIEMWIRPDSEDLFDPNVRSSWFHSWVERDRHTAPKVFRIDTKGGNLRVFEQDVADGEYSNHMVLPIEWQVGEWHHVAYTWGDGERVLYVDGEERLRSEPGRGLPRLGHFFRIGAGAWGMDRAEGLIDEVRIWDRALTPDGFRGLEP